MYRVYLTLVESGLVDFVLQLLGHLGPLQHTILTECEPVLQKILAQAERDDERLPGEARAIKPPGQTTQEIHGRKLYFRDGMCLVRTEQQSYRRVDTCVCQARRLIPSPLPSFETLLAPQQALLMRKASQAELEASDADMCSNQSIEIGNAVAIVRRAHRKPITGPATSGCRRRECTLTSLVSWQRLRSSLA